MVNNELSYGAPHISEIPPQGSQFHHLTTVLVPLTQLPTKKQALMKDCWGTQVTKTRNGPLPRGV